MDHEELLAAAALNLAGWHDSSVRALGSASATGAWWWTAPTPAPWIYFTAVELRRPASRTERRAALDELRHHLDDPDGSFEAVCDTFGAHRLERVGLQRRSRGRWYARAAGPPPPDAGSGTDTSTGLAISEVRDRDELAEFEQATCLAFGAPPPIAPFDIHDPGILDDPAMHVLVGRAPLDRSDAGPESGLESGATDPVVAGAMAYVTDAVVGIYGVGTVPAHRRRGHAHALTAACLAIAPDRPATLQPSAAAASLYRRLGFVDVGPFTHWG